MSARLQPSFAPPILAAARDLLAGYDVLFCDIWGVLHDGKLAFPASNDALTRFRAGGGTVVLVSNAPAPVDGVAETLSEKGVLPTTYDAIVSSGEQALAHIRATGFKRVHRIGAAARDHRFFSELALPDTPLSECDAIACTGLVDDRNESGESYRERLRPAAARGVPFVCANPDRVVHVGHTLYPCAGAIAAVYEDLGGPVVWCGKPHASAYVLAFAKAAALRGKPVVPERVLAIGDAIHFDLAGAKTAGIDALFISSGIHRDAVMTDGRIDPIAMQAELTKAGIGATAAMTYLSW
jgi:HAD superfamily hydrolase (TIGR01459 family)